MKLTRLTLRGFTVFSDATFDFAPGVNVLIGENGTGKSHVLKVVYALTEAARRFASGEGLERGAEPKLDDLVRGMLMGVFLPDSLNSFSSTIPGQADISLEWEDARIEVTLPTYAAMTSRAIGDLSRIGRPLFIPPREVLSIFPGFVEAWLRRESAFDRTYFDLCVALGLNPLRSRGPAALRDPIEQELGGKVFMKDGRFYLDYPGNDMEITMVAEGDRKLAMIAYLLINGSLSGNSYLLWDEPEANLNPKRARLTSDTSAGLAHAGAQVFIATHDYALTSELSLKIDTGALPPGTPLSSRSAATGCMMSLSNAASGSPSSSTTRSSTPLRRCTSGNNRPSSRRASPRDEGHRRGEYPLRVRRKLDPGGEVGRQPRLQGRHRKAQRRVDR